MAVPLSAYWVKFFIGAGFPQDVATKHAVVFSNNRIKPDMLPDLDKPSLKEMGITLMGDMIAILRYAKKVVEETTCEKFLVDSEDPLMSKVTPKPVIKKPVSKVITRSNLTGKLKTEPPKNPSIKKIAPSMPTSMVSKKKVVPTTKVISHYIEKEKAETNLKRKFDSGSDDYGSDDDSGTWVNNSPKKQLVQSDGYKTVVSTDTMLRSKKILKKVIDQKRTVFDRLGDSSVTSTTNLTEATLTFNVTGLGSEVFKRNSSVFNRLGDRESKKNQLPYVGILKNGSNTATPSILKNSPIRVGNTILTTKKVVKLTPKPIGTMRADQEKKHKAVVGKTKLVPMMKKITFDESSRSNTTKVIRKFAISSKLASQQIPTLPAKARLGTSSLTPKQVTFKKNAMVTHLPKPGVFSRLGV